MTSDHGWTLIARFSNNDALNWMKDSALWWYDKDVASGETTDPSNNADMISPAFWLVGGTEFKITRSDDPQHTALLKTTNLCLAGLRRLGPKSQTIVTSETVKFCPEINIMFGTM